MAEGVAPEQAGQAAVFPPLPAPDECHVWTATAEQLESVHEHLLALLDPAERTRSGRYRRPLPQLMFVASRAAQRILAGRYLGRDPAGVTIDRRCQHCGDDGHGRPRVAGTDAERNGLDFSVTHTGQLLLVAHVSRGAVGVDAERVDRQSDTAGLARSVLAAAEAELVSAAPEARRGEAFCRLWVRKEAALKLTGHGITVPLRSVDVTRNAIPAGAAWQPPGWPASAIRITEVPLAAPGYLAAVATTFPVRTVTIRSAAAFLRWPDPFTAP